MSHEVRTPLHGMLGMLQVMSRRAAGRPAERARRHRPGGRPLLLDCSTTCWTSAGRGRRGRGATPDVDARRLLRDALDGVRGTAHLKGLALDLHLAPDLPDAVRTDPDRLRQVLLNLLGNAVKFTDAGGITLTADAPPGRSVVSVVDTGPGMPPADVDRLFSAFEQGDAGRRHGGTGLGLALCQQLVQALGGLAHRLERAGREHLHRRPAGAARRRRHP
jgi:signal transduction histidine kinase